MIDISVILPVYNRENFLEKSLDSLEKQSFKNFELLIVDDGSSDSSCVIVEKFCKRNSNWKLFKLDHKGVSNARIHGINHSVGKYLSFVDSDDYVEPNFLEVLFNNIGNSQISVCNYRTQYGNSKIKIVSIWFHRSGTFSRNQMMKSLIMDLSMKSFLWNKLFDRNLFKDIFIPEMCFEDKIMCLQLFSKIEKCNITNKVLYNYHKNTSSLTWKMNEKTLDDYIKFSEFLKDFLMSTNEYKNFHISHKIFSFHVFIIIFKVLFYKYVIENKDIICFFEKLIYNYKRIIKSIKLKNIAKNK